MRWNKSIKITVILILSFFARIALGIDIQPLVNNKFPGWKVYQQVEGDLNGDTMPDVAAILYKESDSESGQTQLVIYLNDGKGGYQLNTLASKAICVGCGGIKAGPGPLGELSIQKGQLHIDSSGGSREQFGDKLKWRFDKARNKFILIGETYFLTDTAGSPLEAEIGDDSAPEVPEELLDEDGNAGDLPTDSFDINFLSLKAEKTIVRNYLAQKDGKNILITKKTKYNCVVPSMFKAIMLENFNYENHQNDVVEEISKRCVAQGSLLE